MPTIRLSRGSVYVSGDDAGDMSKISSVARFHKGRGQWRLPLARDVVQGLRGLGLELPEELGRWEAEQDRLEVLRAQANEFKTTPAAELRRRLETAGVRFREHLYDHQIRAVAYALRLPACGLFMDTGTGKTAVAATVMQALVDRLGYKKCLVVAPKSILDVGWGRDLDRFSWLPWVNISDPPPRAPVTKCPVCGRTFARHVSSAHLRSHGLEPDEARQKFPELIPPSLDDKRSRLLRALGREDKIVFLINPESFKLVIEDLADQFWDMIVVDESSMIKSPKAEITARMITFGSLVKRRLCMTATPRPNSSLDLWGQMAFLDQSLGGDFYRFRDLHFFQGHDGYSWLPRHQDTDQRIWSVVEDRSYRVRLEDCVSLPGETMEQISVALEGKLLLHYRDMVREMSTTLDDGRVVDTSWQIVQANKLAQITSGYIFDDRGTPQFLDHSPKVEATLAMARRLIENEDRFVVIWVRFPQTEGDRMQEELSKYGVSTLHGHTPNVQKSVDAFLARRHRVMIAHTASAKFGHTWTHSNVAIFHSYDYSWENFYQAKRRIYRIGQKSPVTYVVCTARGTIDEVIMERVFAKESASDVVVDGLERKQP